MASSDASAQITSGLSGGDSSNASDNACEQEVPSNSFEGVSPSRKALETVSQGLEWPSPLIGDKAKEPGFWAKRAQGDNWRRGRRISKDPNSALFKLKQMTLVREPAVRKEDNAWNFNTTLAQKTANVEALLVQSAGEERRGENACRHCQQGCGPFSICVQAPGVFDDCANCHFAGLGRRCGFNPAKVAGIEEGRNNAVSKILQELKIAIGNSHPTVDVGEDWINRLREVEIMIHQKVDGA